MKGIDERITLKSSCYLDVYCSGSHTGKQHLAMLQILLTFFNYEGAKAIDGRVGEG